MADYIEGRRAVLEAFRNQTPIEELLVADHLPREGILKDIERAAKAAHTPLRRASHKELDGLSERGSHQGVMARVAPFPYVSLHELIKAPGHDPQAAELVIVLDHLTDAGNFGAIARSAESVGALGLVIPSKRSVSVTAATYKSSAGAVTGLAIARVANIVQSLEALKKEGFWVVGATEHADELVWDQDLSGRIALVMGNEKSGLARLTQESCDLLAALPQRGAISSLNVAQASTVFMYEWLRQNRFGLAGGEGSAV